MRRFHASLDTQNGAQNGARPAEENIDGVSKRTRGIGKFMLARQHAAVISIGDNDDDDNDVVVEARCKREQEEGAEENSRAQKRSMKVKPADLR
jgi:hypothetical protein